MLNEMSPEQFNEWLAFSLVEPFGDQWSHTGALCAVVDNLLATKESRIRQPADYRPGLPAAETETEAETIEDSFDRMEAAYGKS